MVIDICFFLLDYGKTYVNPIIGGSKEIFEIIQDQANSEKYPITINKKMIVETDEKGIKKSW